MNNVDITNFSVFEWLQKTNCRNACFLAGIKITKVIKDYKSGKDISDEEDNFDV